MLYINSTLHFVGLNYLMTLFDTLEYLSLFAKKKQKNVRKQTKAKKRERKQLQRSTS